MSLFKSKSVMITLLAIASLLLFAAPGYSQRVIVVPSTYAPSGYTVSDFVTTTSSAASTNICTTACMVYGLTVDASTDTSDIIEWINFFNVASASVTAGTTAATFSIRLNPSRTPDKTVIPIGESVALSFSTALSANCTTTRNGATHSTVGCHVVAVTKR